MRLVTFNFELDGDEKAPPLLLVHGLLSSRDHWLPNLAALNEAYRTIRIDLPGHGETALPEDEAALSPDRIVDAIEALRIQLGIERWFICGQSVGAGLTLRYSLAYPDRVLGQIFTNANAVIRAFPDDEQMQQHADRVARLRDPSARPFDRETIHPRLAKRFPPEMRERLVEVVNAMDPQDFATFIDGVMPQLSLRYYLPRVKVPTCLINGRFERRFQPLRDWAEDNMPGLEIHDVDGGHSVNIEAPEAFNAAARAFLDRVTGSSMHKYEFQIHNAE